MESVFHQVFSQGFVGVLGLEYDSLRDDDSGASAGGEMFEDVVHKQDFAVVGFNGESSVRANAAFWGHERRVGEDDFKVLVPLVMVGEGVVFVDLRLLVLVQEHIDQGEANHIRGDVVSMDIFGELSVFVGGEVIAVELAVGIDGVVAVSGEGELMFFGAKGGGVFAEDSEVCGDEESGGAACGIQNSFALLGRDDFGDEFYDVPGGSELSGFFLCSKDGEDVFKGVAEVLAAAGGELVHFLEEEEKGLGVFEGDGGAAKHLAEYGGEFFVVGHFFDGLMVKLDALLPADFRGRGFYPMRIGRIRR